MTERDEFEERRNLLECEMHYGHVPMYDGSVYCVDEATGAACDCVEGYSMDEGDDIAVVVGRDGYALVMCFEVYTRHSELFEALGCITHFYEYDGDLETLDESIGDALYIESKKGVK